MCYYPSSAFIAVDVLCFYCLLLTERVDKLAVLMISLSVTGAFHFPGSPEIFANCESKIYVNGKCRSNSGCARSSSITLRLLAFLLTRRLEWPSWSTRWPRVLRSNFFAIVRARRIPSCSNQGEMRAFASTCAVHNVTASCMHLSTLGVCSLSRGTFAQTPSK